MEEIDGYEPQTSYSLVGVKRDLIRNNLTDVKTGRDSLKQT